MAAAVQEYILLTKENHSRVIRIIQKLCATRRLSTLTRMLARLHATTLALMWESFEESEREIILSLLQKERAAEFLTELDADEQSAIFRSKDTSWIFDRLEELQTDDIADIIKNLNPRDANFILRRFDKDYTEKIKELLKYREGTAGALMSSDFLAVSRQATVKSIIAQFQKLADEQKFDDLQFVFVVDRNNKFLGYISLRKLLIEKGDKKASEIMTQAQIKITPDRDQEEVAQIFKDYNLLSLPVVNESGILLGHITVDDVVDVIEDEASEDILRLGGVLGSDALVSATVAKMAKGRLPWLAFNLATQMLAASIITIFNDTLGKALILAPLMTIVSGQGGNATVQTITIIVRSMALGEISKQNFVRTLLREIGIGLINGLLIGALLAGIVYLVEQKLYLSFAVMIAMTINMLIAATIGALIPVMMRALKIDPALASGPVCTTFTDICGFSAFLGAATFFMKHAGSL